MGTYTLHRGDQNRWMVGDTRVFLLRLGDEWGIGTSCMDAKDQLLWLQAHELLDVRFETRALALRALIATMESADDFPLPSGFAERDRLIRVQSGEYHTADRHYCVRRYRKGHEKWLLSYRGMGTTVRSLWMAQQHIHADRERYARLLRSEQLA